MKNFKFLVLTFFCIFLFCKNKKENLEKNKIDKVVTVKEVFVFDAGGVDYPPFKILKIKEFNYTKYVYKNEKLNDSIVIKFKYNIFNKLPNEFISTSGGNFSSPNDTSGFLYEIRLKNGNVNKWGVFKDNYAYSKEISNFNTFIDSIYSN
jgi:hypothetical protein